MGTIIVDIFSAVIIRSHILNDLACTVMRLIYLAQFQVSLQVFNISFDRRPGTKVSKYSQRSFHGNFCVSL